MKNTTYITTPIYYVNDIPHLGAWYTTIMTDILSRGYLIAGFETRMQTGTDEHGQKIQKSAIARNISEIELCNETSKKFYDMVINANVSAAYNDFDIQNFNKFEEILKDRENTNLFANGENFIRTTNGRDLKTGQLDLQNIPNSHIEYVINVWNKLKSNGFIYKGEYSGWYAIRDEAFYKESELVNGKAPTGAEVEWREEECYFFKLSAFQKILLSIYLNKSDFILPKAKSSEVISFVSGKSISESIQGAYEDGNLSDLCVSRPNLSWGVPIEDNQSVYVWLDALTNYISCLKTEEKRDKFWLNRSDNSKVIHIVGKDILRFHCVYWPAFLIGMHYNLQEIEEINSSELNDIYSKHKDKLDKILPDSIFAHGWWTVNGDKMSKSLKNGIYPDEEIDSLVQAGIHLDIATDYFRYFMVKAMPFGNDGDYIRSSMITSINADLVNNIGNLVQRVVTMVCKNLDSKCTFVDDNFVEIELFINSSQDRLLEMKFDEYLKEILSFSSKCNDYIDIHKPWALAKDGKIDELSLVLNNMLTRIFVIGAILQPICPVISSKMLDIFNCSNISYSDIVNYMKKNNHITLNQQGIICPRIQLK